MENLVYFLGDKTYINITNSCTNRCIFCIRNIKDDVKGANLWLRNDNVKAEDVIEQLKLKKEQIKNEIIFCGYGEPLLRFNEVKKVAQFIKENMTDVKVRINTNGHASAVFKVDIPSELKGLVDEISISLNGENEKIYNEMSQPQIQNAYQEMQKFALQCKNAGISTVMSVVVGYKNFEIDTEKCREIAENLGAKFRVREWEENGY